MFEAANPRGMLVPRPTEQSNKNHCRPGPEQGADVDKNTRQSGERIPVWTWRDAVRRTPIAPLTKLVCYSLANYLSDAGRTAAPTIEMLIEDTGLSNRSIATHLQHAVGIGLLAIKRRTARDGRYLRNVYLPRFPDTVSVAWAPAQDEPDDLDDQPEDEGNEDEVAAAGMQYLHADETTVGKVHVNLLHVAM